VNGTRRRVCKRVSMPNSPDCVRSSAFTAWRDGRLLVIGDRSGSRTPDGRNRHDRGRAVVPNRPRSPGWRGASGSSTQATGGPAQIDEQTPGQAGSGRGRAGGPVACRGHNPAHDIVPLPRIVDRSGRRRDVNPAHRVLSIAFPSSPSDARPGRNTGAQQGHRHRAGGPATAARRPEPIRRRGVRVGRPRRECPLTPADPPRNLRIMQAQTRFATRRHIDLLRVTSAACRPAVSGSV
jgi:hypothetical protein